MSQLDRIRAAFPDLKDKSDSEVLGEVTRRTGASFEEVANTLGVDPSGTLYESGRQFVGGLVVNAPRIAGQALKYLGEGEGPEQSKTFPTLGPRRGYGDFGQHYGRPTIEASPAYRAGEALVEYADEAEPGWTPDLRDKGIIGRTAVEASRAIGAMAPGVAAAFIPGTQGLAPALSGVYFGGGSAQDTYEKLISQGVSEEDALAAARRVFGIQGVGETIATRATLGLIRPVQTALRGSKTTADVAAKLTGTTALKDFGVNYLKNLTIQPLTEVAQDASTELVERAYGAKPEDLGLITSESARIGFGVAAILGVFGAGSSLQRGRQADKLRADLESDDPIRQKMAYELVAKAAESQGVGREDINAWLEERLKEEAQIQRENLQESYDAGEQRDLLQIGYDQPSNIDITPTGLVQVGTRPGAAYTPRDEQTPAGRVIPRAVPAEQEPLQQVETRGVQGDLFQAATAGPIDLTEAPAATQETEQPVRFDTRFTATVLKGLGLTPKSPTYRKLLGKDMADPMQQGAISEVFNKVYADTTIANPDETLSALRGQVLGAVGQQQEMIGPRGGAVPAGQPSTAQQLTEEQLAQEEAARVAAVQAQAPTPIEAAPVEVAQPAPLQQVETKPQPVTPPPADPEFNAAEKKLVNGIDAKLASTDIEGERAALTAMRARIVDKARARAATVQGAPAPATEVAVTPGEDTAGGSFTQDADVEADTEAPAITDAEAAKEDADVKAILTALEKDEDAAGTKVLRAAIKSDKKAAPGRPSFPAQVYAAIRNKIIKPASKLVIRQEGKANIDKEATAKYGEKANRIANAARAFANAYNAYTSYNMVRSQAKDADADVQIDEDAKVGTGEVLKRGSEEATITARTAELEQLANKVRVALRQLGEAVDGNAKDVEAVVRFVKDRAQKQGTTPVETQRADIRLSTAWAAAKRETFTGSPDFLDVTSDNTRQSREATARGADPQLVLAAQDGFATFGKGKKEKGVNGVLNYTRTVGTPYEKMLARLIKIAMKGSPKIEFKAGKSEYNPKTHTMTMDPESSKEVVLHEMLHAALQHFVYTNPTSVEVKSLINAVNRVIRFDTKALSPKAAEVQSILKKLMADNKPLDAVLELVSYGNTLNEFRKALTKMETDTPRTFVKFANDVFRIVEGFVSRILGVKRSVANDVLENTIRLLDQAAASPDMQANKGGVLKAEVKGDGDQYFSQKAFDDVDQGYKSRSKIVYMSPQQFLALSKAGTSEFKTDRVESVLKGNDKFSSVPYLTIEDDLDGGTSRVVGHEGRHRARALIARGVKSMPVHIRGNIRWSEQTDPEAFDFIEKLPTKLQAQDGAADSGFTITYPVTRGDLGQTLFATVKTENGKNTMTVVSGKPTFTLNFMRLAFEAAGFGEGGKVDQKVQQATAQTVDFIKKNLPGAEVALRYVNSHFGFAPKLQELGDKFKQESQTSLQVATDFLKYLYVNPQDAQKAIAYLDGDQNALTNKGNDVRLRMNADILKANIDRYIKELPPADRILLQNMKFSERLLLPEKTSDIASKAFGVNKVSKSIVKETRTEDSIDIFRQYLDFKDGVLGSDQVLYQLMEDLPLPDGTTKRVPYGFISKSLANQHPELDIDRSRNWHLEKSTKENADKFSFVAKAIPSVSIAKLAGDLQNKNIDPDTKEAALETMTAALLNTVAALSKNYAVKNYVNSLNTFGDMDGKKTASSVVFDTVEEATEAMGIPFTEKKVIDASSPEIKDSKIARETMRSDRLVRLPAEGFGELSGKLISAPVWSNMQDMNDRSPLVNSRTLADTMTWFKKAKTVYTPSTHANNILTNYSMLLLHGIPTSTLGSAGKIMYKYYKNPGALTKEERTAMEGFLKSGAILGQYTNSEAKAFIADKFIRSMEGNNDSSILTKLASLAKFEKEFAKITTATATVARTAKIVDAKTTELYAAGDNVFRLAAYLNTLKVLQEKNDGKYTEDIGQQAGLAARKMFLDYDIDAKAIRAARQSVLPFISWTYAILPVLGRLAITRPWAMANMLMAIGLVNSLMDGDDDEWRKMGPEQVREKSLFGLGPHNFVRLPFMGDDENPVYWNVGKSVPMMSVFDPVAGKTAIFGQNWLPSSINPGGPYVGLIAAAMFGIDPFTGKKLNDVTDDYFDTAVNRAAGVFNNMAPSLLQISGVNKAEGMRLKLYGETADFLDGMQGPTGNAKNALHIARFFGLSMYQYNEQETRFYNSQEAQKIKREFMTEINSMNRDAARRGYPDYEEFDKRVRKLVDRMYEEMRKAEGIEE